MLQQAINDFKAVCIVSICLVAIGCASEHQETMLPPANSQNASPSDQTGIQLPLPDFEHSNWHMFQVLLPLERLTISRGELIAQLKEAGIGAGVHYPAMHLFTLYRRQGYQAGDFPVAEHIGARTLTLPLFPAMADGDVDRVCTTLSHLLRQAQK